MQIIRMAYDGEKTVTDECAAQPFTPDSELYVRVINFPSDRGFIKQLMSRVGADEPAVYGNGEAVLTFTARALAELAQQGRATRPCDIQEVLNKAFLDVAQS